MLQPRQQLPPRSEDLLAEIISVIEGVNNARCLTLASCAMMVYEYFLTLDDEIKYFWTGKWTTTRVLYLLNRYLPLIVLSLAITCFMAPGLTIEFCDGAIRTTFILNVTAMAVAQAVLVLRIWYLFRHSKAARALVVVCFVACVVSEFTALGLSFEDLHSEINPLPGVHILELGCSAPPPSKLWRMFIPSFVLHTIFYLFTAYRGIRNRSIAAEPAPLMGRLLRDGGVLYFVVFFTVGFSAIGAIMTQHPSINLPAIYSNFMLSITSICISRVMLGIRSLAAELVSDPALILNNAELSRVCWKKGPNPGELIVDANDYDNEFGVLDICREIDHKFDMESNKDSSIDKVSRIDSPV